MKMTILKNRGFTLIELLVVIAIIGILASVVLASLNSARDKGEDAAVKSNLNNVRAQAALYYDDEGDYDLVCSDPNVANARTAANGTCTADADGFTMTAELNAGGFYCVDSTGDAATTTTAVSDGTTWTDGTYTCSDL